MQEDFSIMYNCKIYFSFIITYVLECTYFLLEVLNGFFIITLGEKPANVQTRLRFGLHWHIDAEEKRIIEGYGIFDLPGFFIQGGVDLFKRAHDEQEIKITLLKD